MLPFRSSASAQPIVHTDASFPELQTINDDAPLIWSVQALATRACVGRWYQEH